MKKYLLLLVVSLLPLGVSAQTVIGDVEVDGVSCILIDFDGVYYALNEEDKTVSLVDIPYDPDESHACEFVVTDFIPYNGETYPVTAIYCSFPKGLISVTIPNSVTTIFSGAFGGCTKLTTITLPEKLTSIPEHMFYGCTSLASVTIPNSVTLIGESAFYECKSLTSVTIGDKVTSIGVNAFRECTSLASVAIPNSVTSIGTSAFFDCTGLKTITLSENLTAIENNTFYSCGSLKSITIPGGVTTIGNHAFERCSSLTTVHIQNGVKSIGTYAFLDCTNLTSVSIPNSVTSIGDGAFENCFGITKIAIPNSVTSIGSWAFYCCELQSFTIPNGLTTIAGSLFGQCPFTSFTIPAHVSSIGANAFSNCLSLTDVFCLSTDVPTTDPQTFYCTYLTVEPYRMTLHVPKGCKEKYAAVSPWNEFGNIVEIGGDVVGPVELKMTAKEDNGLVRLRFNSVPGDISYRVNRTDDHGVSASFDEKGSCYPDNVEYVDIPPATGTYTYAVKMAYHDVSGDQHVAKSNAVTVTIAQPQHEEATKEYGFIMGRIVCDKTPPTSGLKVRFSDVDVTVNARGAIFSRYSIPVGTELTMTVSGDPSHDYEPATIQVKAGLNTVAIQGTLKDDYEPNENAHDLQIAPDFSVYSRDGKHYVKCTLINPHASFSWGGTVSAEVIPYYESFKSWWTGEKPVYRGEVTVPSLRSENTQVVDIALNGLEVDKDTKFKLYLKSNGKWLRDGFYDETAEKSLITTTGWDITDYEVMIEKTESSDGTYKKWNKVAREDFSYLMLGLSSITPGMEGIVGDFSNYQYRNKMVAFAKEFTDELDDTKAIRALFEWLSGKTALEMINEFSLFNVSSFSYDLIQELKNIVLPQQSIFQKLRKDYIITASDIQDASGMIGSISSVASAITSHDPFECIMNCASAFYGLASEGTVLGC